MDQSRYITLLQKKMDGLLSQAEAREFANWESQDPEALMLRKVWEKTGSYKENYQPDVEAGLARFQARMRAEQTPVVTLPTARRFNWRKLAAALALLIAVGFALQWLLTDNTPLQALQTEAQIQEAFTLPDGSIVWLNQHSRLEYPAAFDGNQRAVQLKGEAFFEVVPDTEHPFIIHTPEGSVRVLGTSFNVRAYPDENFEEVLVVSGKVAYDPTAIAEQAQLVAGQWSVYQKKEKNLAARNQADQNLLSWRTGRIQFETSPMREVLKTLERSYGLQLNISQLGPILDCPFTTTFQGQTAEEALRTIELAFGIKKEKITSNSYRLIGGSCN